MKLNFYKFFDCSHNEYKLTCSYARKYAIPEMEFIHNADKCNDLNEIFELIPDKVVYAVVRNCCKKTLLIKTKVDEYCVFVEDNCFMTPENGDALFSTLEEAQASIRKSKEIWNIIRQTINVMGTEVKITVDSFKTKESALARYREWLENDKKISTNLEETPKKDLIGECEYIYDIGGELHRVIVVKSTLD